MAEEWLCSELKLCQLVTVPRTAPSNDWNAEEVVINTQKYPDFDQASVFITLKAYTDTLYEAWGKSSHLNKQHREQNVLEPYNVQTDLLHHYAEMLCGDILHMATRRRSTLSTEDDTGHDPQKTANNQPDQTEVVKQTRSDAERQAEMLAGQIYTSALEELAIQNSLTGNSSGQLPTDGLPKQMDQIDSVREIHNEPGSFLYSSSCQPEMEVPTKKRRDNGGPHILEGSVDDAGARDQGSGSTAYHNTLNGMVTVGSLDYPDAPPSTPLLPGLVRSRASFSRKLKGGLAKEFMPSPPPPTPKDQQVESLPEDKMAETVTNNSEFMVRLMRSLSLACVQCGDLDEEEQGMKAEGKFQTGITTLSEYAARLSADLIHCASTTQPCVNMKERTPGRDVHVLADHLAEEIILMSIAEVMGSMELDGKGEQNSPSSHAEELLQDTEERTHVFVNALVPRSSPDVPAMEVLRALSAKLVANILVQAFSELGVDALQYSLRYLLPGAVSEPVAWATGSDQYANSCLDDKCHQITTLDLSAQESEPDYITDGIRTKTLTAEHSFAERIVEEALQCSIRELCKSNVNQMSTISDRPSSSVLSPRSTEHAVVKGIISDTQCYETQELQCVLLWAAASHMGASVLRLQLSESQIHPQLHRVSSRARFHGWTVKDLMAYLLQYSEDLQKSSRGHCKSSGSLLGHLLLCVD